MKNIVRRTIGFLGVTLVAAQLIGLPASAAIPFSGSGSSFEQAMPVTSVQKEVDRLLKQIVSNAAVTSNHADKLDSFARVGSRLSFGSHAAELTAAKEAINRMGADFRQLQELRPAALLWQQLLIDRMDPLLVGLAGHTTQAIERLNEDRGQLPSQDYRDAVSNMYSYAEQARNLVAVNLEYAQAREKLNRLDIAALEPVANLEPAQNTAAASPKPVKSLHQRVRTELLKLPYYGVFDHLAFQVNGNQVTVTGAVSWPALKTDAERAVRSIEGVEAVTSNIKVLPLSPNDDRIRLATYWAIYGNSALAHYRLNPHAPIRIIVENGNVTLRGVVATEMDRTIAHMQASRVPGAFTVTNNLQVGS